MSRPPGEEDHRVSAEFSTSTMDAAEAHACVVAINQHLNGARDLLLDLYEREGWRALGYDSWRECVVAEFDHSQAHLYRQLQAARVERELSPMGEKPIPERRLREVLAAPPEQREALIEQARQLPSKDLAALVREARSELTDRQERDLPPPVQLAPIVLSRKATARFYVGDVREVLDGLEPEFAQCAITSPPFWGLRDYKITPGIWGGDREHDHAWEDAPWRWYPGGSSPSTSTLSGGGKQHQVDVSHRAGMGAFCACGAWRGQLGLEPWPRLYVEHIVEAFRAVRRALRRDGVLWLEIGDSYAGSGKGPTGWSGIGDHDERQGFTGEGHKRLVARENGAVLQQTSQANPEPGIKPKDLLGIPWRVAFALQADGWWLRQDNVWARPNPMPESVKDRTTRAHSYVFQLARSRRYYYDADAVSETVSGTSHLRGNGLNPKAEADEFAVDERTHGRTHRSPAARSSMMANRVNELVDQRNKRSVWTVPTRPFSGAHFATFPPDLVEDPIKATSRPGDVVLDPFAGAGTVALVSARLGRDSVGIDANEAYLRDIAMPRLLNDAPMLVEVADMSACDDIAATGPANPERSRP
jgi:hypothetical protein